MSISLAAVLSASWFDPLQRWEYPRRTPAKSSAAPLLAYVPGLDGTHGSPFVQLPRFAEAGFEVAFEDVDFDNPAPTLDAACRTVTDYLRANNAEGRRTLLMGESFGGVVAAAVALRSPSLVSGLILVNPATAFSQRPALQADAAALERVPAPLFGAACWALLGRKTFDAAFLLTAAKDVLIERKLEKLRESDPGLARFYDAAIAELVGQVGNAPRDFMLARLRLLKDGCAELESRLPSLSPPLLVVAGTADGLLQSDAEARRLQDLLGADRCAVHLVEGAGHAGTLDARIDLLGVVERWLGVTDWAKT